MTKNEGGIMLRMANFIHLLIAAAIVIILADSKRYWRKYRYPGLLLLAAASAAILAILWLALKINMFYTGYCFLVLGLVILIFYLFNRRQYHFLLLTAGTLANGLVIALNNGYMPVAAYINIDNPYYKAISDEIIFPFLCDWVLLPYNRGFFSPGDILILLFLLVIFAGFAYRTATFVFQSLVAFFDKLPPPPLPPLR